MRQDGVMRPSCMAKLISEVGTDQLCKDQSSPRKKVLGNMLELASFP